MHDDTIPAPVVAFIVEHISSVIHLEVLLLLQSRSDRSFTADELGRELHVNVEWIASQARSLCDKGILVCLGDAVRRYQFVPKTPDFAQTVEDLSRAYAERRVSVVTLIFNKPVHRDAPRIRSESGNG